jgi:energy-coupling factor transporter ATP-binding protein EcfA2
MDQTSPPRSVLETILDWSRQRPGWQRDALRRIVAEGSLDEAGVAEITALCRKEHGSEGIDLQPVPLAAVHLPANPGAGSAIALASIRGIVGVNQLAKEQELTFEPAGLTVIYGQNGAGKSGYARILKRACRARHAGEIMPDAFDDPPAGKATATITISRCGVPQPPLAWRDTGQPHPVLSAISVFDKDCASVHLRENEVAFRPFGLDIPDELAAICQKVKDRLNAEQRQLEALRDPIFAKPTWKPDTVVGKFLGKLRPDTDVGQLEKLAVVSDNDKARESRLTEDLLREPVAAAAQQLLFADTVRQLAAAVEAAATAYADERLASIKALSEAARTKRDAAKVAAQQAFDGLAIPGVGAEAWRTLWESARHYAEHIAYRGCPFPPEQDGICVLCHQPLDNTARARMMSFERFVREDIAAQADAAEKAFNQAKNALVADRVGVAGIAQTRRRIGIENTHLARKVLRFLASARFRRAKFLAALGKDDALDLPPFAESPISDLADFEGDLRRYAAELEKAADPVGRRDLQSELNELRDRIAAAELLFIARREVERLQRIRLVQTCLGDTATNAITRLGNDIADNVITPKMRDEFQSEIVRLAANRVRVEVVRSGGQFGSPQYQVRFFANPKAKVHNVLSEGEQTCVALAAFLAELATASHNSALVFDDPVSSLDHLWRDQVAQRLVEETHRRQIIVFTHDLIFVNDLHDKAVSAGAKVKMVTLTRGPGGAGIVADGLPWRASRIRDRIDKMEKAARAARKLYECNDEDGYRSAALPIYGELRASWERAIEDIAFGGVIHRHRDYIETRHLKKATVLEEADCDAFDTAFKRCCDLIEAHDPSRGRDAAVPSPEDILKDIKTLADWAASLRDRQKPTSAAG